MRSVSPCVNFVSHLWKSYFRHQAYFYGSSSTLISFRFFLCCSFHSLVIKLWFAFFAFKIRWLSFPCHYIILFAQSTVWLLHVANDLFWNLGVCYIHWNRFSVSGVNFHEACHSEGSSPYMVIITNARVDLFLLEMLLISMFQIALMDAKDVKWITVSFHQDFWEVKYCYYIPVAKIKLDYFY